MDIYTLCTWISLQMRCGHGAHNYLLFPTMKWIVLMLYKSFWLQIKEFLKKGLFVMDFSSHSSIYHSYWDVTITGEGLQILSYAALVAIEQWDFFSVPHLLWQGASVYNGYCGIIKIPWSKFSWFVNFLQVRGDEILWISWLGREGWKER